MSYAKDFFQQKWPLSLFYYKNDKVVSQSCALKLVEWFMSEAHGSLP
ncbi:hypothetical protein D048_2519 [Vibrio parahaemolyticus VPTS-2009]|nr:hypothetical protein D048_2519 [Vibrio parahaemolyticus VPTS-2009]